MNKNEKELCVLSLSYSRFVSKAHTLLSVWVTSFIALTIGFFGLVLSFYSIFGSTIDRYKLIIIGLISGILLAVVSFIIAIIWFHSYYERKMIVSKIRSLR